MVSQFLTPTMCWAENCSDCYVIFVQNDLVELLYIYNNFCSLIFSAFVAVLNVVEYFMQQIHRQRPDAEKYGNSHV